MPGRAPCPRQALSARCAHTAPGCCLQCAAAAAAAARAARAPIAPAGVQPRQLAGLSEHALAKRHPACPADTQGHPRAAGSGPCSHRRAAARPTAGCARRWWQRTPVTQVARPARVGRCAHTRTSWARAQHRAPRQQTPGAPQGAWPRPPPHLLYISPSCASTGDSRLDLSPPAASAAASAWPATASPASHSFSEQRTCRRRTQASPGSHARARVVQVHNPPPCQRQQRAPGASAHLRDAQQRIGLHLQSRPRRQQGRRLPCSCRPSRVPALCRRRCRRRIGALLVQLCSRGAVSAGCGPVRRCQARRRAGHALQLQRAARPAGLQLAGACGCWRVTQCVLHEQQGRGVLRRGAAVSCGQAGAEGCCLPIQPACQQRPGLQQGGGQLQL